MRRLKGLKGKLVVAVCVFSFCLFLRMTKTTCLIFKLTGIPCLGCGMTRAVLAILRMDFETALGYHPLVFLLPLIGAYYLLDGNIFGKKADAVLLAVILLAFLVVWLLRLYGVLAMP